MLQEVFTNRLETNEKLEHLKNEVEILIKEVEDIKEPNGNFNEKITALCSHHKGCHQCPPFNLMSGLVIPSTPQEGKKGLTLT